MPRLEPKQIQKELENGILWPVYWIYGDERMKSRELLKRIRRAIFGDPVKSALGFGEEVLDGAELSASEMVESAQCLALGGGPRFVIVQDAHAIKESEKLADLLGKPGNKDELSSVCVFLAKDLDGRKKFSKLLLEKAAVVSCESVAEQDREAWIQYLAKKRGFELPVDLLVRLRSLDPWSLDIVDQELEKYEISGKSLEIIQIAGGAFEGADAFFEAFFGRDFKRASELVGEFADSPEESLPLLGLMAWNVRQLAILFADRAHGTRQLKLNPFIAERFTRWSKKWSLGEMLSLQKALAELDYSIKQTPKMPLGLWAELIMRFV